VTVRRIVTGEPSEDLPYLEEAARVLLNKGLVAFPTETVYGLGALAIAPDAVQRIFSAKGRPSDDPLIVHVLETWPLEWVLDDPSPLTRQLVENCWPGPLTIVAPRSLSVPSVVTAGLDTVAVRAPRHAIARKLLALTGIPIAAPSANRFNYISPTSADHVWADLAGKCDLILDAGPTETGIESTVIRVEQDETLTVLRHGAVPVETIVAAGLMQPREPFHRTERLSSPGRGPKHYSPTTRTVVKRRSRPISPADLFAQAVVLLHYDPPSNVPPSWTTVSLGNRSDLDTVARHLYSHLRAADTLGADVIVAELTEELGIGRAIDDRLLRAASGVALGDV